MKATERPTRDYSIKTLAEYLGFEWRDAHPSGAASIEWHDRRAETGDPAIKQRILDYNEDDCRATRVLLDGIREMCEVVACEQAGAEYTNLRFIPRVRERELAPHPASTHGEGLRRAVGGARHRRLRG
jgi:RNase_H superfamily